MIHIILTAFPGVYADGKIYIDGGNTYVPRNGKTFYNTEAKDYGPGMRKFSLNLADHPTN